MWQVNEFLEASMMRLAKYAVCLYMIDLMWLYMISEVFVAKFYIEQLLEVCNKRSEASFEVRLGLLVRKLYLFSYFELFLFYWSPGRIIKDCCLSMKSEEQILHAQNKVMTYVVTVFGWHSRIFCRSIWKTAICICADCFLLPLLPSPILFQCESLTLLCHTFSTSFQL